MFGQGDTTNIRRNSASFYLYNLALFVLIAAFSIGIAFTFKTAVAEDQSFIGAEAYKGVKPRDGVYNDGKAIFWDLEIIDHFKYFGFPEKAIGYKPQQPINFSHVTHVQKNKMDCQYCHWSVTKSPFATLPELQICAGCHNPTFKLIPGKDEAAKKELEKLYEYINKGEAIPWVKVHVTPDHLRFNHKRHVKAGVGCQECHGQIPVMEQVERVSSMKMGWCVECHREKGTSIDCWTCHK